MKNIDLKFVGKIDPTDQRHITEDMTSLINPATLDSALTIKKVGGCHYTISPDEGIKIDFNSNQRPRIVSYGPGQVKDDPRIGLSIEYNGRRFTFYRMPLKE